MSGTTAGSSAHESSLVEELVAPLPALGHKGRVEVELAGEIVLFSSASACARTAWGVSRLGGVLHPLLLGQPGGVHGVFHPQQSLTLLSCYNLFPHKSLALPLVISLELMTGGTIVDHVISNSVVLLSTG